jgi:hypothetical protein
VRAADRFCADRSVPVAWQMYAFFCAGSLGFARMVAPDYCGVVARGCIDSALRRFSFTLPCQSRLGSG